VESNWRFNVALYGLVADGCYLFAPLLTNLNTGIGRLKTNAFVNGIFYQKDALGQFQRVFGFNFFQPFPGSSFQVGPDH